MPKSIEELDQALAILSARRMKIEADMHVIIADLAGGKSYDGFYRQLDDIDELVALRKLHKALLKKEKAAHHDVETHYKVSQMGKAARQRDAKLKELEDQR